MLVYNEWKMCALKQKQKQALYISIKPFKDCIIIYVIFICDMKRGFPLLILCPILMILNISFDVIVGITSPPQLICPSFWSLPN